MEGVEKEIRHEAAVKLRQKFIEILTDNTTQLLGYWKEYPQTPQLEECKKHLTEWTLYLISSENEDDDGRIALATNCWQGLEEYSKYLSFVEMGVLRVNRQEMRDIAASIPHAHSYDI